MDRDVLQAIDEAENFSRDEFPESVAGCEPVLIDTLQDYRRYIKIPIYPSLHPAAWARTEGSTTSWHYKRLAGDCFPGGDVLWAMEAAKKFFNGIGIYFDTARTERQPGPMLHLDLRPGPLVLWCRDPEGNYIYPSRDSGERADFYNLLADHAVGLI